MLGQIIVTLASAGRGHGSISQAFHVVTFVKPLIYRKGAPPAKAHRFQNGASRQWRKVMKQMSLTTGVIAASTFACAALLSFGWSEQGGVSLSVESAQARVGRPLTPVSVAGVARRQNRRAVYGGGYGAGVVGAGAVAVGTAAAIGTAGAVAATSPNWGWGAGPAYTGTGYYAGGPYYSGTVRGARAAYYGGYPPGAWGGMSRGDRDLYIKNLHDSGYNPKDNFSANGNIKG